MHFGHAQVFGQSIKAKLLLGDRGLKNDDSNNERRYCCDHERGPRNSAASGCRLWHQPQMRISTSLGLRCRSTARRGQVLTHSGVATRPRARRGRCCHAATSQRSMTRKRADDARGLRACSSALGCFATRTFCHARGAVRDG